jgi:folate-binding protein YgfZ
VVPDGALRQIHSRTPAGKIHFMTLLTEPTQCIHAARLPFLGLLRVGGEDAARFLQGQLTNDTRLLADGRTQLSALNTPQGRVVAVLRLRQTEDAIYALLPQELTATVAASLRRFVLRARVDLQIAVDLHAAWLGGQTFSDTLDLASLAATRTQSPISESGATEIVSFDYGPGRRVIAADGATLRAMTGLSLERLHPAIENEWRAADIAAGLPQVVAATSGSFVPQMLNLDRLDAISFTKGCYTGQEIVARTQHLGRIKRRTLRYRLPPGPELAPLAGLSLAGQKIAEVLTSATSNAAVELLAVSSLEALGCTLLAEDGREAVPVEMPYRLGDGG